MLKKIITLELLLIAFSINVFARNEHISLDGLWSFNIDSTQQGFNSQWFKIGLPASKEMVIVPHTWNVKKEIARYWGWAWYQRNIDVPKNWNCKTIRLQFNAVYHDATIWVNGIMAGEYKGSGFTKFFIDATKYSKTGAQNAITVLADNSFSNTTIPYSISFDWPSDGGIIRSVNMQATNSVYIGQVHAMAKTDYSNPKKPSGTLAVKVALNEINKVDTKLLACKKIVIEEN